MKEGKEERKSGPDERNRREGRNVKGRRSRTKERRRRGKEGRSVKWKDHEPVSHRGGRDRRGRIGLSKQPVTPLVHHSASQAASHVASHPVTPPASQSRRQPAI